MTGLPAADAPATGSPATGRRTAGTPVLDRAAERPRVPAPLRRRVGAQAVFEMRTVLRNGEQLVITLVLPLLLLVVLARTTLIDLGTTDRIDLVAPGVLALAVMSTAFTSQAIATGFDRRNGVLRLLATTPLGKGGLVVGKIIAVLVLQTGQFVVLGGAAFALGWRPHLGGAPAAVVVVLLGTAAFTSFALLLAGLLRAEAVLAAANLVWVLLLAAGGVLLPVDLLPGPMGSLAALLPSGALGEALRSALTGGGLPTVAATALVVWTAVLGAAAVRFFRWD